MLQILVDHAPLIVGIILIAILAVGLMTGAHRLNEEKENDHDVN